MQKIQLPVAGMTCDGCVRSIERKLSVTPGVTSAKVDLAAATATVEFDPDRARVDDLVRVIRGLGFEVPGGPPA